MSPRVCLADHFPYTPNNSDFACRAWGLQTVVVGSAFGRASGEILVLSLFVCITTYAIDTSSADGASRYVNGWVGALLHFYFGIPGYFYFGALPYVLISWFSFWDSNPVICGKCWYSTIVLYVCMVWSFKTLVVIRLWHHDHKFSLGVSVLEVSEPLILLCFLESGMQLWFSNYGMRTNTFQIQSFGNPRSFSNKTVCYFGKWSSIAIFSLRPPLFLS